MRIQRRRTSRAFTLMEMLVTCAIVAIVASILAVVISGAKRDAKKAACAFNLRQMGVGVNMYLQDNDDFYPQTMGHSTPQPAVDDADGSLDHPNRGFMLDFLGLDSTGIADCPADPDVEDNACFAQPSFDATITSYIINAYFVFGLNQFQIINGDASTIMLAERRNSFGPHGEPPNCSVIYHPWFNPSNSLAPRNDMDATVGAIDTLRHEGGSNYLFADGHAIWRNWTQTYDPTHGINFHLPY